MNLMSILSPFLYVYFFTLGLFFGEYVGIMFCCWAASAPSFCVSVAYGAVFPAWGILLFSCVYRAHYVSLCRGTQVVRVDDVHVGEVAVRFDGGFYSSFVLPPDDEMQIGFLVTPVNYQNFRAAFSYLFHPYPGLFVSHL